VALTAASVMSGSSDQFQRTLVAHNLLIRSICNHCGFVIVSSVTQGLQEKEEEHLEVCSRRARVA
jgi:hypothetical protein